MLLLFLLLVVVVVLLLILFLRDGVDGFGSSQPCFISHLFTFYFNLLLLLFIITCFLFIIFITTSTWGDSHFWKQFLH